MSDYRVEVTREQPGQPNGQAIQSFNCSDLDQVWKTITVHRNKVGTKRIRVWNLMEVIEVR